MLDTVTYSEFRAHMANYVEMILEASTPLRVKLKDGHNLLVSLETPKKSRKSTAKKKKKMDETEYLMASPANHKMLMDAINGDPKKRIRYESVDDLRKELGL